MKKILLATLLTGSSFMALADWQVGGSYTTLTDADDVELGAIVGQVGYEFSPTESFTIAPRLRLGTGVKDDEWEFFIGNPITIELDRLTALDTKFQFNMGDSIYMWAMPSYVNVKFSASIENEKVSADEWEFGGGLGLGYRIDKQYSVETSYEYIDGLDIITLGVTYTF